MVLEQQNDTDQEKLKNDDDNVEFELVIEGLEEEDQDPKEDAELSEEEKLKAQKEAEEKEVLEKEKQEKRKSRSRDRIQKLVKENKEKERELETLQKQIEDLRKQGDSFQKQSASRARENAESVLDSLETQLQKAVEDGDYKKQVEVNRKISEATVDLRIAKAQEEKFESLKPDVELEAPVEKQQQKEIPEKLQDWLDGNTWFFDPAKKRLQSYVVGLADDLKAEGINEDEDEFYERIDEELVKRFPDQFGVNDTSDVQLSQEDKKSSSGPGS